MIKALFVFLFLINSVYAEELIKPIPLHVNIDKDKAALGKKLFFDTRLSNDNTIACISCHDITSGGADYGPVSFGVHGKKGSVNSPTVFNAVYNIAQFWDGRAKDLKDQASGPMMNPVEMASNPKQIVAKLSKDPGYVKSFQKIYNDSITIDHIADAIAEFEKSLTTPNSKFDRYLRGDVDALNEKEKQGYTLFKNLGCISCHNGVNIGSNMFQKFGVFITNKENTKNLGRYNVTKNEADKYYFKVPTLRNVARTAPYFHDGSAKTLKEAVKTMGYYQLGIKLSDKEVKDIVLFLNTLNGDIPK